MRSDLPRSRPPRRSPAINLVATLTTRSPRATRNRSKLPETCRQSSSAHTRSAPRPRAHASAWSKPRSPTRIVMSLSSSPLRAPTAAMVCERLCASAPSTIITWSPFTSTESGRPADNACLGAVPRSYQVTPGHPDRRRATQRKPVRPQGRQRESESARRRSGPSPARRTSPDAPNHNSKREAGAWPDGVPLLRGTSSSIGARLPLSAGSRRTEPARRACRNDREASVRPGAVIAAPLRRSRSAGR